MNTSIFFRATRWILMLTLLSVFSSQVFAHAHLASSVPEANSQVKMSPPNLVLTFEKPAMVMNLTLTDDKGKAIDFNFKASNDTKVTHQYKLPPFGNGLYTVNWTAMGTDGHNMKGAFTFSVGAEAKPAAQNHEGMKEHDHAGKDMDHSGHTK
ncbi:copper resistance CopC family protein [Cellvibrio zantedeschiae]|nr:copper resistance protein CopC [Cellvibrio zantedeschiae]